MGLPVKAEKTADAAGVLCKEGELSARLIANKLNISTTTLYAHLRRR